MNVASWNLPLWLVYTPGGVLSLVVILSNPDVVPRQYSMSLRVRQNGQLVSEEPVTIDGSPALQIYSGESLLVYNDVAIPATNITLELVVLDATTAEYLGSVTVNLLSSVPAITQLTNALPGIGALLLTGVMLKELGAG